MSFVNRGTHEGLGLFFPGPESEVIHIELPVGSAADRPRPHRPSSPPLHLCSGGRSSLTCVSSPAHGLETLLAECGPWLRLLWESLLSSANGSGVGTSRPVAVSESRVCLTHGFVPKKTMTQCWCLLHVACLSSYCMYSCVSCIVFSTAVGF